MCFCPCFKRVGKRHLICTLQQPMQDAKEPLFNAADEEKTTQDATGQVIPVVEERVVITKEVVETGKVHIRKRVSEEEAVVNLPLIQEGYLVERRPGSKDLLTTYPAVRHEGENTIIPVVREVLVVEKRYEVLEEIHIIKSITEVPHLQQITLLKESVDIRRTSGND